MKRLILLALIVAATGVYIQQSDVLGTSTAEQGVVAAPDAEQTFVRVKGLKEPALQLREAGLASLAQSVDGYRERALEHLERGEVERANDIATQGYELAEQGLGEPLPELASQQSPPAAKPAAPVARGGGGSLLTEQMVVVDMVGTLDNGDVQPNIRGARTKASAAAASLAASQKLIDEQMPD